MILLNTRYAQDTKSPKLRGLRLFAFNSGRSASGFLSAAFACLALAASASADNTTFRLATELLGEQRYTLSAVEFRRFAMEAPAPPEQAAAYLYSGYAYLQAGEPDSSSEMLDRAEAADGESSYANELALLYAETARLQKDAGSALYFYDILAEDGSGEPYRIFALRRSAAIHLANGDTAAARTQLERSPADESAALQALQAYAGGKDKSPKIGGWLGLIPGAGYWYSGEIANGFRSLLLNGVFIFGMVHTAQEDQWGAFAAITFF